MVDYLENRRHFRLKQHFDVQWVLPNSIYRGFGSVLNISQSGLQLVTDQVFPVSQATQVELQPTEDMDKPFFSKKGHIVWFKRLSGEQPRYQCGISFTQDNLDESFALWLREKQQALAEGINANIIQHYVF